MIEGGKKSVNFDLAQFNRTPVGGDDSTLGKKKHFDIPDVGPRAQEAPVTVRERRAAAQAERAEKAASRDETDEKPPSFVRRNSGKIGAATGAVVGVGAAALASTLGHLLVGPGGWALAAIIPGIIGSIIARRAANRQTGPVVTAANLAALAAEDGDTAAEKDVPEQRSRAASLGADSVEHVNSLTAGNLAALEAEDGDTAAEKDVPEQRSRAASLGGDSVEHVNSLTAGNLAALQSETSADAGMSWGPMSSIHSEKSPSLRSFASEADLAAALVEGQHVSTQGEKEGAGGQLANEPKDSHQKDGRNLWQRWAPAWLGGRSNPNA